MGWEGWFTALLTVTVLITLIKTSIKPHIVMMSALTLLSVLGILDASEALAGFSNSGLITVSAMFVVAAGIQHSGGIELLVNKLLGQPSTLKSALVRVFLPVVPLSAFLNNTPVVATMIPALVSWSKKTGIAPSKLLIPLSYAAILGGTLTLIGTSTNLVVNGQYQSLTGNASFGFFDITLVGLPVAVLGLVAMYFFAPALLPNRQEHNPFSNLREFTLEVCVSHAGPLVGKSVKQAGLRDLKQVYLVEIERGHTVLSAVSSDEVLYGGDRLVFTGESQSITELMRIHGLEAPAQLEKSSLEDPHAGRVLVEVVVSTHCDAIGSDIRDAQFRNRYGAVVLAVARNGERLTSNLGNIILQAGDTLLLEARPAFVSRQQYNKDFLLVNNIEQDIPNHTKASLSWLILGTAVAAAALNFTSMLNAALVAAGVMLMTRCLSIKQAEKSLDLGVYLTIAASFALGSALQKTGASEYLAHAIVDLSAGDALLLLVLTYISVSIMTEMITNNAAAILILPVILEITAQANLNPEPYIFAIMMAASASFATPLGYQTNLMVMGPGNYRFSDFLRIGLPMNIFIGIVTIAILASFWSLSL